ncbi:MAG TPA: hypothetical protein VGN97_12355 [Mesorhizobium sp.]|jgi:hypothetical protein|nr:hypothetical protein [Mesorhizobium sp.]
MALKTIIDNLDEVSEALRGEYKEIDGKFVLDLDGVNDHPAVVNLKSAHERQKQTNRTLSTELASAKERLEGLPDDFDADAYEALRQQAEGKEPPKLDERLNAQKTQLEAKFAKDRQKLEDRAAKLEKSLRRTKIDEGLTKALLDAGVDKQFLPAAKALLKEKGQIKLVEEDDDVEVFADDGVNDRTPLTDYVKKWAGEDEGKPFIAKATGGDAKGGNGRTFGENPFDPKNPNKTKQQELIVANDAKARQMAESVGVKPYW